MPKPILPGTPTHTVPDCSVRDGYTQVLAYPYLMVAGFSPPVRAVGWLQ